MAHRGYLFTGDRTPARSLSCPYQEDARQLKRKRKAEAQHAQLSTILSTFNLNDKAAVESTPSTVMSSCVTGAVGDGEMVPKKLLQAKEEELKIIKAKLRKSEATCRRLTLALLDKIEIARDRALQKPCCPTPLEGTVMAEFISLPSTNSTAGLSQGVLQELVALPSNAEPPLALCKDSSLHQPATPAVVDLLAASCGALPSPDSLLEDMQEEPPHPSSAVALPSSPGCSPNDGGPHQEEGAFIAAPAPAVFVPAMIVHEPAPALQVLPLAPVPEQRQANVPPAIEPKLFDVIDGQVHLTPGVSMPVSKFNLALLAKTDSKCVIEASRSLWTQEQLASRSVTGTACRNKPGSKAKKEATPAKMEALRNVLGRYVALHPRASEKDVARVAAFGDIMTNFLTDCGRRARKRLERLAAKEAAAAEEVAATGNAAKE